MKFSNLKMNKMQELIFTRKMLKKQTIIAVENNQHDEIQTMVFNKERTIGEVSFQLAAKICQNKIESIFWQSKNGEVIDLELPKDKYLLEIIERKFITKINPKLKFG